MPGLPFSMMTVPAGNDLGVMRRRELLDVLLRQSRKQRRVLDVHPAHPSGRTVLVRWPPTSGQGGPPGRVDYAGARGLTTRAGRSRAGRRDQCRSVTTKREPPSSVTGDSTRTVPPMAAASSATIASPSPEPMPAIRAPVGPVEPLEHPRQVPGGDAGAVVVDGDHAAARGRIVGQRHGHGAAGERDGVLEEVRQELGQSVGIGRQTGGRRASLVARPGTWSTTGNPLLAAAGRNPSAVVVTTSAHRWGAWRSTSAAPRASSGRADHPTRRSSRRDSAMITSAACPLSSIAPS